MESAVHNGGDSGSVEERMGVVSRWRRTHCFIQSNNESIFGHASQVKWLDERKKITLRPGMEVAFRVRVGREGKQEAFGISAIGGGPLDFHQKFGNTDPYDRVVQYDGRVFHGEIKFFDSTQLYGKIALLDELEETEHTAKLNRDNIFFKAVDALGQVYPFRIRRKDECTFKLYHSLKYGWGACDVMDANQMPWPPYHKETSHK